MANTWNKEELERLYETLTLEEIGQRYGVSRERVRQVMDKFKIKRRTPNPQAGIGKNRKVTKVEIGDSSITNAKIGSIEVDKFTAALEKLAAPICSACDGKKYIEYEHGLIQMPCGKCQK